MENPPPKIVVKPPTSRPAKRRSQNQLFIVIGVLAALAIGVVLMARGLFSGGSSSAKPEAPKKPVEQTNPTRPKDVEPVVAVTPLIDDDGKTLWASPTAGKPLDLRYLPPGCSLILALRPSELMEHPEAEKLIASLGPRGAASVAELERILGSELSHIEQLLLGMRSAPSLALDVTLVATYEEKQDPNGSGSWTVYAPPPSNGETIVFGSPQAIQEIKEQGDSPPLLRREMEMLAKSSDSERQVTLLVAPNFLFADGQAVFAGPSVPLRDPLFNQLRDELRAVSVSANWSGDFFVEVRAVSTSDLTPTQLSVQLAEQVDRWPQQIEDAVLGLVVDAHGRRVVARLPAMMRVLSNYTRVGVEEDQAVLRAYLPIAAGHNLLMAADLLLEQQTAGPATAVGPVASVPPAPKSVAEKLKKVTSLRFDRDTLETALKLLSEDIEVEIVLAGSDLQLDGITKNQSFGIDLSDQPAEKILQEIVRLANPDKTAESLNDVKQKLVYVIKPKEPSGEDVIIVTTRSQANQRKDELPTVFRPSS